MVEDEIQTPPDVTASVEAEPTEPAAPAKRRRAKRAAAEKPAAKSAPVKPKTRGLSDQEKLAKVEQIEALVSGGATLKDAVNDVGISDQTYYQWKKATAKSVAETPATSEAMDDELAEFIRLEEENRRLRNLLSEKLRNENAELRKRLGLK
ncbi:hypothetical protein JL39_09595 [Rhizobium sp. YS-1r]|nr:hypothetical protein JL39_09595 [Rhizobium sp. YS-1r]